MFEKVTLFAEARFASDPVTHIQSVRLTTLIVKWNHLHVIGGMGSLVEKYLTPAVISELVLDQLNNNVFPQFDSPEKPGAGGRTSTTFF